MIEFPPLILNYHVCDVLIRFIDFFLDNSFFTISISKSLSHGKILCSILLFFYYHFNSNCKWNILFCFHFCWNSKWNRYWCFFDFKFFLFYFFSFLVLLVSRVSPIFVLDLDWLILNLRTLSFLDNAWLIRVNNDRCFEALNWVYIYIHDIWSIINYWLLVNYWWNFIFLGCNLNIL